MLAASLKMELPNNIIFHCAIYTLPDLWAWCNDGWLVGWLEFSVAFKHKYGYIRDALGV